MIGKQVLQIKSDDFLKGMGTSDYSNDGGFSSASYGITPQATPGVMYGSEPITDVSTNIVGNLIASCEGTAGAKYRLFVDAGGHFYSVDSTGAFSAQWTGAKTYQKGITDAVTFNNLFYVSSTSDVAQWDGGATHTEAWFSALGGGTPGPLTSTYPHPLLVYQEKLWVANGATLYSVTTGGAVTSALTLAVGEVIMALGIDPQSGQMLISSQTLPVITGIQASTRFVYLYSGTTLTYSRKIPVNDLVTAFYAVNGIVYIGSVQRLGYWNGNGVQFLRTMDNIGLAQSPDQVLTKQNFSNAGSTLFITNGTYVVAYGEVQSGGKKVFWNIQKMSGTITCLGLCSNNLLMVGYATNSCAIFNTTNTGGQGLFLSNRYDFPRPIQVRRIRVFTTGVTTNVGLGQVGVYNTETGVNVLSATPSFLVTSAQSPKYVFDYDLTSTKQQMAQFYFSLPGSQTVGVNRMVVYYDVVE